MVFYGKLTGFLVNCWIFSVYRSVFLFYYFKKSLNFDFFIPTSRFSTVLKSMLTAFDD
jgi:hypothetical protein